MKSISLLTGALLVMFLCLQSCDSAKKIDPKVTDFSYSYGARIASSLAQMQFSDDERNVEEFIAGFKVGLDGDEEKLNESLTILQSRMQTREPSATPEEAKVIAFNMGINAIGGLSREVEITSDEFDFESMKKGFTDVETSQPLRFEENVMDSLIQDFFMPYQEKLQAAREEKMRSESAENIAAGQAFLTENANKPGVVVLESGLQYEVIQEGTGAKPTMEDQVKTHYHGTLLDGTVFDSSVDRGQPATFPLGGVIEGWQEGIQLMSVGAKYKFYIPSELAYGDRGAGQKIGAGATLIFEVELLEINPSM